jgi:hypothetical protein
MSLQAIYASLALIGVVAEISLLIILLVRRQYVSYPVFTFYIAFNVLTDVGLAAVLAAFPRHVGESVAFLLLPLQYMIDLGVLFEVAWHVLRPVQPSLPPGTIRVFVGLVVLAMLGGTLLAWEFRHSGNQINDIKRPLDLTVGFLRMLIFAVTAGFAQVLGIGWKNKELQLASALSFYSAVDLIVSLAARHSAGFDAYEPIRGLAYFLELGFLIFAFTTKEVGRREFSPQMEQFLVTLAARVRVARTALVRTQVK